MSLIYENYSQSQYQQRKNIPNDNPLNHPKPVNRVQGNAPSQKPQLPEEKHIRFSSNAEIFSTPNPKLLYSNQQNTQQQYCNHQMENELNQLIRQMNYGEQCYDQLLQENMMIKDQLQLQNGQLVNQLMNEVSDVKAQLQKLQNQTQKDGEMHNQNTQLKLESEKLKDQLRELVSLKQELSALRQQNAKLSEEIERKKYLEDLSNERGEQVKFLQEKIKEFKQIMNDKERLLATVNDLQINLEISKNDNLRLNKQIHQLEIQVQNPSRQDSQPRLQNEQTIIQKDYIIADLSKQILMLQRNDQQHEIDHLRRENDQLHQKINQQSKSNQRLSFHKTEVKKAPFEPRNEIPEKPSYMNPNWVDNSKRQTNTLRYSEQKNNSITNNSRVSHLFYIEPN